MRCKAPIANSASKNSLKNTGDLQDADVRRVQEKLLK